MYENSLICSLFTKSLSDDINPTAWSSGKDSNVSGSSISYKEITKKDFNNNDVTYGAAIFSSAYFYTPNTRYIGGDKSFTISFWFYINGASRKELIYGTLFDVINGNFNCAYIGVDYTLSTPSFGIKRAKNNHYINNIIEKQWHHVAIVYDNSIQKLSYYFDGNLYHYDDTYVKRIQLQSLIFGRLREKDTDNNTWDYLNGYLKDFQIYDGVAKFSGESINIYDNINDIKYSSQNQNYLNHNTFAFSGSTEYSMQVDDSNIYLPYHGSLTVKDVSSLNTFNKFKHFNDTNAIYFNGKSGMYFENPIGLFNKNFTLSFWAKSTTTVTDISKTIFCLRSVHPEKKGPPYSYPNIWIDTMYHSSEGWQDSAINNYYAPANVGPGTNLYYSKWKVGTHYLEADNTVWNNYTIVYYRSTNTLYFYIDGKLITNMNMQSDIHNYNFYLCFGFKDISDNDSKFIGYINNFSLKLDYLIDTSKDYDTIPEIYAGQTLRDAEVKECQSSLYANKSIINELLKNTCNFMGTTIQAIGNVSFKENINNTVYNNNILDAHKEKTTDEYGDTYYKTSLGIYRSEFLKAIYVERNSSIYTESLIELFRRNLTIHCWIKKAENGSTIIPFAFTQMHPIQLPSPRDFSIAECLNNICIVIENDKIVFKNLLYLNSRNANSITVKTGAYNYLYYNDSTGKDVERTGFSSSYSLTGVSKKEELYSINNFWNHIAMVFVAKTKTFYFYLNGKKIFSSNTNILYNELAYYFCIGGEGSDSFYINAINITNNVAECTADTWVKYYEEPENTEFTNAYFAFTSGGYNDENKNNTWLQKGDPVVKTNLVFDSFNNIIHPQLNFTKAVYLNGSSGFCTRNSIKLFNKDFTISGWFKSTANPGANSYTNLIKLTPFPPSFDPIARYGESEDICLSLWATNVYWNKEDKAGTLYSFSEYYLGLVNNFDNVKTYKDYKYSLSSDESMVTCTIRKPGNNYTSPMYCGDSDTVDTWNNNKNPLLLHWCHFALVYKKDKNTLYFYYNGKLDQTVRISSNSINYYIMLGLGYFDSNNTGCFTGYVKDFEIDYGTAKYTENTIPEIYADSIDVNVYNFTSGELGIWSYKDKEIDVTTTFIFKSPNILNGRFTLGDDYLTNSAMEAIFQFDFYSIYGNTPIKKNVQYLNGYYENIYMTKDHNIYPENSVYFDGNTGLVSKNLIKLFNSNFTLHMFFNYRGPKNPSTKKYLFRILSVDPKNGYNSNGKVSAIDAYILNDTLYFRMKSGKGYSLNPTGIDNFTSTSEHYECHVSVSSKSLYNSKSVGNFYSEYTICDYWCNITLTYDSAKKTFHCYYNGKQIGTMVVAEDFKQYMYYIYIGCGDYNNKDVNWIGYIENIYMNIGAAKCTAETFPQYYYGTYFSLNNLTTTIPFKDYSKAVTSIDSNKLGIFAAAGALANKSITAPTFDDSREITTNAYFNGKAGLYTIAPLNLGYKGFTIDFWALSKSTKKSGHEVLFKLLSYSPTGQVNTSDSWIKTYDDETSIDIIPIFVLCYNFYDGEGLDSISYGTNWFTKVVRDTTNTKYVYYSYYAVQNYTTGVYSYKSKAISNVTAQQWGETYDILNTGNIKLKDFTTKWNHIAISVNNTYNHNTKKIYIYINGTLSDSFEVYTVFDYMYYLQIGFDNTLNNNNKWIGYITDFKISSPDSLSENFFPGIQEAPTISSFKSSLSLTNIGNALYGSSTGGITWTGKGRLIVDSGLTNIKTFNISKHKPFSEGTYFDGEDLIFTNKQLKIFDKDFTTSFWAKFNADDTIANSSRFLLRISGAPPSYDVSGTALPNLVLYYNNSSASIGFELYTSTTNTTTTLSGTSSYFYKSISAPLLNEKWYHFAICYTKNDNKFYLYINGELVYTVILSLDLSQYTYYVYLGGAYKHNFASGWVGYIRNFEIVSQTNVAAYYTADKIPSIWAPPTLSNFKANLPFTSNLNDSYNNTWETKATPPAVINIEDAIYGFNSKKHGRFTKALYLNGNMGMYTYNSVELFNKDFTISLWANLDKIIVTTKYLLQILPVSPVDSASGITMPGFNIYYNNNYIRFAHFTFTSRSQSSNGGYSTKFEISKYLPEIKLQFHHFAINYTANNKKFYFYIDGKLVGTNVSTVDLTYFVYYFYIGLYYNTANMYDWQGYIRNLEIDATTAKYTEDTISGIYAEPDVVVNTPIKVRRIIAALRSRIFNTKMRYAIDAPILYKISIRTVIQKPIVKQDLKRFIRALRIANQSLIRRVAHRQKYQFNKTKRLLSKYLEFKFDAYRISERTRKAIAISVKSLQ